MLPYVTSQAQLCCSVLPCAMQATGSVFSGMAWQHLFTFASLASWMWQLIAARFPALSHVCQVMRLCLAHWEMGNAQILSLSIGCPRKDGAASAVTHDQQRSAGNERVKMHLNPGMHKLSLSQSCDCWLQALPRCWRTLLKVKFSPEWLGSQAWALHLQGEAALPSALARTPALSVLVLKVCEKTDFSRTRIANNCKWCTYMWLLWVTVVGQHSIFRSR